MRAARYGAAHCLPSVEDRRQGVADACVLSGGHQSFQHLCKRPLHARHDVLPAVCPQHTFRDLFTLHVTQRAADVLEEILRIDHCLLLQDAVDGTH